MSNVWAVSSASITFRGRRVWSWYEYGHVSTDERSSSARNKSPADALRLVKPRAHSRSALGAATARRGHAADRQLASVAVAGLSCRGNAEQLGDLDAAASRTVGHITSAADQGLEGMVARLTVILVKWHRRSDSSIAEARGDCVVTTNTPPAVRRRASFEYSRRQAQGCQCREDWVNLYEDRGLIPEE